MEKLLGGVVACAIVLVAAACGGTGPAPEDASAEPTAPSVVAAGETAAVEGVSYQIASSAQEPTIVTPGTTYEADGVYLIVELDVGVEGEAARVQADDVVLVTSEGEEHEIDSRGYRAYDAKLQSHAYRENEIDPNRPEPLYGFFDVPAGTTRKALAIFDVPRQAVEGARLGVGPEDGRTLFELT